MQLVSYHKVMPPEESERTVAPIPIPIPTNTEYPSSVVCAAASATVADLESALGQD